MATSPNFSWPEPDNTDLVKNGALAIRTAVNAIDSSMADLKGGTTGQVLTKASGTDMDFTWATASGGSNQFYAGKNKIINGDFYVNQRNFTSTTTYGAYGFDRWWIDASAGTTYSAQTFTPGTAPVSGYEGKNFARLVTASQSGGGDYAAIDQRIEEVRNFAGQTVTVSLWAKASTGTPKIGVAIDQHFGSGGSANVTTSGGTATISSSWARYSFTFAVPSVSGKTIGTGSYINLYLMTSVGTTVSGSGYPAVGLQNVTIDFWGVQMEAGSSATDFQTATGTIQGELAACQRYYFRATSAQGGVYSQFTSFAPAYSSTNVSMPVPVPVTMRANPTSVDYSTVTLSDGTNFVTASSVGIDSHSSATVPKVSAGATGLTATTRSYSLWANNSSTAYLGISAEL